MGHRHFLTLQQYSVKEIQNLVSKTVEIKANLKAGGKLDSFLAQKTLAMVGY